MTTKVVRPATGPMNEWCKTDTVGLSLLPYFVPPRLLNIFFSTLVILMLELVHLLCSAAGCTTSVAASTRKPREAKPPTMNVRHIVGNEGESVVPWSENLSRWHICTVRENQNKNCRVSSLPIFISDLILQRDCAWSKLKTSSLV